VNLEALWEIRLRTPRLELRLPNEDELEALYRVAEAGVHPPGEMPFAVPWTDDLQHDAFIAFHRAAWDEWSPARWDCRFVTFLDGRVIGTQDVGAIDFAEKREVATGSWLGQRIQGQGLGTEQRAAVLEFVFRGLGAAAATSGALIHNVASQRISEKLGYRITGMRDIAPRGEPIPHYDYRIERTEWRCPIDVEVEGVEPALPLFGAVPQPG
jgi:RimJ/RimL family protein N-acetyltransferase